MLMRVKAAWRRHDRGDTLIEVTIALSILAIVLLSTTAVVTLAFRTGQTARERTVIAEAAQQQMEALRSYRDNTTDWNTFNSRIAPLATSGFYMKLVTAAGTTQWVPTAGTLSGSNVAAAGMDASSWVPTATMKFTSPTPGGPPPGGEQDCGFDFELSYSFTPVGGGTAATNDIKTRLTNLHYSPPLGVPSCP